MSFTEYIKPELLVLVPVLYLVGMAIKRSEIRDKLIPWILGASSVVLCAVWIFANCECETTADVFTAIFTAITQGVLIAGASVYANQLVKQTGKDE